MAGYLFVGMVTVALFGGSFLFWGERLLAAEGTVERSQTSEEIVLMFVGDIMLDRGVEAEIKKHGDWRWPFLRIADTLQTADLLFGNLESQISDKGQKQGTMYSFRAEPAAADSLRYAGFDVMSVTNNHSLDYGRTALQDSISRLHTAGIATAPTTKILKDTSMSFHAFSQWSLPRAWQEQVQHDTADIVIVSIHGGEEYQEEPSAFQKTFATQAVDAGADIVIGHHAHVVQPVGQYNNGWIAYGLGNFVFDQDFSQATMQGLLLKVIVQDKKIKEVIPIKTKLNPLFQVELILNT
jgi:gamma-polyglutamate biosynthesis protein CapA